MHAWLRCFLATVAVQGLIAGESCASDESPPPRDVPAAVSRPVDFVRDIEPILARHCYDCHGPDLQEGRLRLDARQIVFKGGHAGPAVIPGKSADSPLVQRIAGLGDEPRMPLDADPLSDEQIARIRAWIDSGAAWPEGVGAQIDSLDVHWAYEKPVRPAVPAVKDGAWIRTPIDAFILERLDQADLQPSPEADRERLIRRVSLDLIGLPPTIDEVEAFLADQRPDAYEKLVDRLLASPRYGERWAVPWLDAARYADSNGYQRDGRREAWAFRDWVISALNADMPFDQFTIEQIAGDLLPATSLSQKLATGFHRGTMANVEAGTDPEEQRVLAVFDRVNTTGTVWLGTTLECAQCHNHKYDPFSQMDYYRLFAIFNTTEAEIESEGSLREFVGPTIDLPLPETQQKRRAALEAELADLKQAAEKLTQTLTAGLPEWERRMAASLGESNWHVLEPIEFASLEGADLRKLDDNSLLCAGDFPGTDIYQVTAKTQLSGVTAFRLEILTDQSLPGGGPGRVEPGNFILSEFQVQAADAAHPQDWQEIEFASASADYSQDKWPVAHAIDGNRKTGWAIGQQFGRGHHAVFVAKSPIGASDETLLKFMLDQQFGRSRTIGRFQLLATTGDPALLDVPANIRKLLEMAADQRNKKQQQELADYYLSQSSEFTMLQDRIKKVQAAYDRTAPPTTLVMQEMAEPRTTNLFVRGDFLNPGSEIEPGVPEALHSLPDNETVPNRLSLARWLVDEDNPLVVRVTVNRQWAEFFGRGLVESVEDFGTQGEPPTHPELLDWLATEFVRQGWSLKAVHRLIVTSAVYRQSSVVTPGLLERDPDNKLYARGPRFRLKAEYIRDNALAIGGLLSPKVGGPPVFPVQPDGLWNHIGRASNVWTTSQGEDLYRRGLYVYWRRTVPYPSFVNFDAPSREACSVQRSRANTPLQALTLMNDPVYFEIATALAGRLLTDPAPEATVEQRVEYGFRLATAREPRAIEIRILADRYQAELARYREDPAAARALIAAWDKPAGVNAAEFAAWIHVANILLNLDEVITKG
jgi:mono/diheme cytochrome c family protein